jgi:hypothetical protein
MSTHQAFTFSMFDTLLARYASPVHFMFKDVRVSVPYSVCLQSTANYSELLVSVGIDMPMSLPDVCTLLPTLCAVIHDELSQLSDLPCTIRWGLSLDQSVSKPWRLYTVDFKGDQPFTGFDLQSLIAD